jgi:hypothetical protein
LWACTRQQIDSDALEEMKLKRNPESLRIQELMSDIKGMKQTIEKKVREVLLGLARSCPLERLPGSRCITGGNWSTSFAGLT